MVNKIIEILKKSFSEVKGHRYKNSQIELSDYLTSAYAMLHLKDPSLHHYRINYEERSSNLQRIYGINELRSDSAMREGLDGILSSELQSCFKPCLELLDNQGIMEEYKVLDKYQCLLFDGTEHYCSCTNPCEHCLTVEHKNKKGEVTTTTYHHKALACVMAHYEHKEVFPVCCEAIVRQDGATKNDCELNSAKRILPIIRDLLETPKYDLLGVFDGLFPNGPFIRALNDINMRFVIAIKEGFVLIQIDTLRKKGELRTKTWIDDKQNKCVASWYYDF